MMRKLISIVTLGLFTAICFNIAHANELASSVVTIKSPIVQALPPGFSLSGGIVLLDLTNTGKENHALVSVSTLAAREVQLQNYITDHQGYSIHRIKRIQLKPHQEQDLSPQGMFIRLINLTQPLKAGDKVPLTLKFEDGSTLDVQATFS